ncbi:MAG TPA: cupin domain-containing protein [Stellaceae bacterium]|nr:cupin domain-containing protein [Stellaceae bacterium]
MRAGRHIAALCCAGSALLAAGFVLGRESAPTDYKSVSEEVLAAIDLAPEVDSVTNRELRLSRAVVMPGGHVGVHSHQGDPTIVYMLSGILTNHHDDGTTEEFRPGQVFAEFGPRSHWVENQGATPAIFIVANIHRRQ